MIIPGVKCPEHGVHLQFYSRKALAGWCCLCNAHWHKPKLPAIQMIGQPGNTSLQTTGVERMHHVSDAERRVVGLVSHARRPARDAGAGSGL